MEKEIKKKTVSGTKEWASQNENCISGCSHECLYCYAKAMALRFGRTTIDTWKIEVRKTEKLTKTFKKKSGRFMFPTTHDITPENLEDCLRFLENILKVGNKVLIVSKPHLDCVQAMTKRFTSYRSQILFRFTIGSSDNEDLAFWEHNAPLFDERLESLAYAHAMGYATSVSCEPLLDSNADHLIGLLRPYVTDAIWIGKANQMITRLKINGHGDHETIQRAKMLMERLSSDYISALYDRYKHDPQIKWKDSIKKMVGIPIAVEAGLDI